MKQIPEWVVFISTEFGGRVFVVVSVEKFEDSEEK